MANLNKFDLPAFFEREYYERHYLEQMARGEIEMAKTWEAFYFDNALSFAWCGVFNSQRKSIGCKKAMVAADEKQKELEKAFK